MKRYLVSVDTTGEQLNDGPIITSPCGGAILWTDLDEAGEAAKALVDGGTVQGAYVHLLRPVAFYLPQQGSVVTLEDTTKDVGDN
jgi:hypothetical protein